MTRTLNTQARRLRQDMSRHIEHDRAWRAEDGCGGYDHRTTKSPTVAYICKRSVSLLTLAVARNYTMTIGWVCMLGQTLDAHAKRSPRHWSWYKLVTTMKHRVRSIAWTSIKHRGLLLRKKESSQPQVLTCCLGKKPLHPLMDRRSNHSTKCSLP